MNADSGVPLGALCATFDYHALHALLSVLLQGRPIVFATLNVAAASNAAAALTRLAYPLDPAASVGIVTDRKRYDIGILNKRDMAQHMLRLDAGTWIADCETGLVAPILAPADTELLPVALKLKDAMKKLTHCDVTQALPPNHQAAVLEGALDLFVTLLGEYRRSSIQSPDGFVLRDDVLRSLIVDGSGNQIFRAVAASAPFVEWKREMGDFERAWRAGQRAMCERHRLWNFFAACFQKFPDDFPEAAKRKGSAMTSFKSFMANARDTVRATVTTSSSSFSSSVAYVQLRRGDAPRYVKAMFVDHQFVASIRRSPPSAAIAATSVNGVAWGTVAPHTGRTFIAYFSRPVGGKRLPLDVLDSFGAYHDALSPTGHVLGTTSDPRPVEQATSSATAAAPASDKMARFRSVLDLKFLMQKPGTSGSSLSTSGQQQHADPSAGQSGAPAPTQQQQQQLDDFF